MESSSCDFGQIYKSVDWSHNMEIYKKNLFLSDWLAAYGSNSEDSLEDNARAPSHLNA